MIKVGNLIFETYYCSYCGAQDTSKSSMNEHEAYHDYMTEWCKGLTTYGRETRNTLSVALETGRVTKQKCLEKHCDRIAVSKGRCQRCYQRDKAKKRKSRARRNASAAILTACILVGMGFA